MPRAPIHEAIARQWEILLRLPSHAPGETVASLTRYLQDERGFRAGRRTVERDLASLSRQFGIRQNDSSVPHGWYWLPRSRPDFGDMDLAEAVTLASAESTIKSLLPMVLLPSIKQKFALARRKLAATAEHPFANWVSRVRMVSPTLPMIAPSLDADVFRTVQNALMRRRCIKVFYESREGAVLRRLTLHPLGMIQRGNVFYLVATASGHDDVRFYAVHRVRSATMSDEDCQVAPDFNLDRYLDAGAAHFGNGGMITVRLRVDPHIDELLQESPLSVDQRITRSRERRIVAAKVADTWQLRWWILSQAEAMEVLAPKRLRREIAESLRSAAAAYGR